MRRRIAAFSPWSSNPLGAVSLLALLLLTPALINGFPLIFTDSAIYLRIAFGGGYAIDRANGYGLLLAPFVRIGGVAGLWAALALQVLFIAGLLILVTRLLLPGDRHHLPWLAAVALLTSLPWHAAQIMPDALTGPLVLLGWLAARHDPRRPMTLLLWAVAVLLALTHYTHLILLAVAGLTALAMEEGLAGRRPRLRQWAAPIIATAGAIMLLTTMNGLLVRQWAVSPGGSAFLFARLNEDGLMPAWLDRHCDIDAPAELCAERPHIVHHSQSLLWTDPDSPIVRHLWHNSDPAERRRWAEMLATANFGAIREQPGAFLGTALRGTTRQFFAFAVLDDECPANCQDDSSVLVRTLRQYLPHGLPAFLASPQADERFPRRLMMLATTPIAMAAMLLAGLALITAIRRRDAAMASLLAAITACLLVNAAMAGSLSDVHDRYQSRLIWLLPFVVMLAWRRWRPIADATPSGPSRLMPAGQDRPMLEI